MNLKSKKISFYYTLIVGILSTLNIGILQAQAFNDANHTRVLLSKYEDVEGSPFFAESWLSGSVKLINGSSYNNLSLKYNQEEDKIYFKGKNDDEVLAFIDPVIEFTLTYPQNSSLYTAHYRNGYSNVAGTNPDSFFEVLADGRVQFLRKVNKTIEERKEYGSATSTKKMVKIVKYYLVDKHNPVLIKLGNKPVLSILNDPKADSYTNKNNLNLKSEEDIVRLLLYYNSL